MAGIEEVVTEKGVEEKMVIHMNIAAHQLLSALLRPISTFRKDWRGVGDLMGFTWEEILNLGCDMDPVENIVRQWERRTDATIAKLISFLEKLGLKNVIEDLQPFIDKTPFPTEHKKRVKERIQQRPVEKRLSWELELLTAHLAISSHVTRQWRHKCGRLVTSLTVVSDEIYDGFICYAAEDRSFANEILQTLEAKPYCLKICIDYRDYVPGNCNLDQTANIIEDRCKRIVVVLSGNFKKSADAGFQLRIALSLSPDARDRRVIPVKYGECDVKILRHITWVDYTDDSTKVYFWTRLAKSLGYEAPPAAANKSLPARPVKVDKKKKKR